MNKKELIIYEKEKCILECVKLFLENDYFIADIAVILNKSTSTIQRYLNDPYVEYTFGSDVKKQIENKLSLKKLQGNYKGGTISNIKYQALKSSDGKFIGVKKR
jgi:hypothetical protein